MMLNRIAILSLTLASLLLAQQGAPLTNDVKLEVLTETIDLGNVSREMSVRIVSESGLQPRVLTLYLSRVPARMTPVTVTLNGEPLWLIQAERNPGNDRVLAWKYDASEGRLMLFPHTWPVPYELQLRLQVNIEPADRPEAESQDSLELQADRSDGTYRAAPTGRGSRITFK